MQLVVFEYSLYVLARFAFEQRLLAVYQLYFFLLECQGLGLEFSASIVGYLVFIDSIGN